MMARPVRRAIDEPRPEHYRAPTKSRLPNISDDIPGAEVGATALADVDDADEERCRLKTDIDFFTYALPAYRRRYAFSQARAKRI